MSKLLLELEKADAARPAEISIRRFELFCVISAVQLACTHPEFTGPSRKIVESIMRQLSDVFPTTARALIEKGWDRKNDQITLNG